MDGRAVPVWRRRTSAKHTAAPTSINVVGLDQTRNTPTSPHRNDWMGTPSRSQRESGPPRAGRPRNDHVSTTVIVTRPAVRSEQPVQTNRYSVEQVVQSAGG